MQEEKAPLSVSHSESHSQFGVWGVVLIVLMCVAVLSLAFVVHEHGVAKRLSSENTTMSAALDQTRNQLQDVTTKLNQLSEAQQAAEAARAAQRAAASQHRTTARVRRDDPRWKQVQDELAAHQKAIESTQSDLTSAKTELSGSIARTHDELVQLAKKGERNYYEFDLNKSKQFTRKGPIGISLRKANSKHDFADLALLVDDAQLQKKHVNEFEPVMLYTSESKQPVELVINAVSKDHIHGYVSTAKYKASDLPALSGLTDTPADNSSTAATANSSSSTPQLQNRAQR
jgi:cell division protein FtsL